VSQVHLNKTRRHARRALAAIAVASTLVAGWAAGCGVDSSLVGGVCAAGFSDCNNQCIATTSDPNNCGGCGVVCSSGVCVNSMCTSAGDAHAEAATDARPRMDGARDGSARDGTSPLDGSLDGDLDAPDGFNVDGRHHKLHDGSTEDGTLADAPAADAHASDGRATDGNVGDARVGDARVGDGGTGVDGCAPPYVTRSSCGACGVACTTGEVCSPSNDGGVDAGPYACAPACTLPYVSCGASCVEIGGDDPENCGACGKACLSGICVSGVCAGSTSGDITVIGHDYATSPRVSEATLLSNAVFLPPTNPLRVLSFEQYASPAQVANVHAVLKAAATTYGRTVNLTVASDNTMVPAQLASAAYDILLVEDQPLAPANSLQGVGNAWQQGLAKFLMAGGDVVVLDGATGAFPQMAAFLSAADLLQVRGETPVAAGTQLLVAASGDAVGNSVLSPYAAQTDTVFFVTTEVNGGSTTFVVDDLSGGFLVPVVVHKTVSPP